MTALCTYNKMLLSINNYLFIRPIDYVHSVSPNFKGHTFMCGPQVPIIFSLGPR
jgi:hypothetical protein